MAIIYFKNYLASNNRVYSGRIFFRVIRLFNRFNHINQDKV